MKRFRGRRKYIEYRVYEGEDDDLVFANVDHLPWREAKKLIASPDPDVILVERVQRWWYDDGTLDREEAETLYERPSGRQEV